MCNMLVILSYKINFEKIENTEQNELWKEEPKSGKW